MTANATAEELAAAQAAAEGALRAFNTEAFTLLAIAILVTGLRTYCRISSVGFKNLWADDYLAVLAIIFYSVETALAYSVGNTAHGLANNSMTPAQRLALKPSDPEYDLRILGSKIQLAGWSTYSTLLWILKGAMCTFYYRLTKDLDGYRKRIFFGFGLVIVTWLVVELNLLLSCRPLYHMWQIYPDPGKYCYPAISPAIVWTYLSFNVITDIYLILIPMPMLWKAAMPAFQKFWLIALFSCGLFVTMAAILRVVLLVSDPINGAQLAGSWAVRETFVAVITTNIPMLFPHAKKHIAPLVAAVGSSLGISRSGGSTAAKTETKLSNITTLDTWRRTSGRSSRHQSGNPTTKNAQSESQEDMVEGMDLQEFLRNSQPDKSDAQSSVSEVIGTPCIQRHTEVSVEAEAPQQDQRRVSLKSGNYTSTWSTQQGLQPSQERSEFFLDHVHQHAYERA